MGMFGSPARLARRPRKPESDRRDMTTPRFEQLIGRMTIALKQYAKCGKCDAHDILEDAYKAGFDDAFIAGYTFPHTRENDRKFKTAEAKAAAEAAT